MKKCFRCYTIIGIVFVLITGSLAHFLYGWTQNNPIVGLFTPVNESVWEHMKLLFFPMLFYGGIMIFRFRDSYPGITASLCLGILAGTMLIPVFFYSYTFILGKDIFALDISTFVLSVGIAFWISYKAALSHRQKPRTLFLCCLVGLLLVCFFWFTYRPSSSFFAAFRSSGEYISRIWLSGI